jgi:hypothetical protein
MSEFRHKHTITITAEVGLSKKIDPETLSDMIREEWSLEPGIDNLKKWNKDLSVDKPDVEVTIKYKKFMVKITPRSGR